MAMKDEGLQVAWAALSTLETFTQYFAKAFLDSQLHRNKSSFSRDVNTGILVASFLIHFYYTAAGNAIMKLQKSMKMYSVRK